MRRSLVELGAKLLMKLGARARVSLMIKGLRVGWVRKNLILKWWTRKVVMRQVNPVTMLLKMGVHQSRKRFRILYRK